MDKCCEATVESHKANLSQIWYHCLLQKGPLCLMIVADSLARLLERFEKHCGTDWRTPWALAIEPLPPPSRHRLYGVTVLLTVFFIVRDRHHGVKVPQKSDAIFKHLQHLLRVGIVNRSAGAGSSSLSFRRLLLAHVSPGMHPSAC
jgi:hypothetical protein